MVVFGLVDQIFSAVFVKNLCSSFKSVAENT